jgi:hypothetical protein
MHNSRFARAVLIASLPWLFSACGGDEPSSGLPPGALLRDLSDTDSRKLCDWAASLFGGYNVRMACPDGSSLYSRPSQQACVDAVVRTEVCMATVADAEACSRWIVQRACAGPTKAVPATCLKVVSCDTQQ